MDHRIESFIEAEKIFTFCTSADNAPYCVNCFYSFMANDHLIVFKSDRSTKHIGNALLNIKIAGTIVPEMHNTASVKGVQFTARFVVPGDELLGKAKSSYYRKYPFALVIPGDLWAVELITVKMIDNTLGFGKKILWENSPVIELENQSCNL